MGRLPHGQTCARRACASGVVPSALELVGGPTEATAAARSPPKGEDLPDNFCGGKLKLRVQLDTAAGRFPAILKVFCIVGPNAARSHDEPAEEGVTLKIPGVIKLQPGRRRREHLRAAGLAKTPLT